MREADATTRRPIMSMLRDPFDPRHAPGCGCGRHARQADHYAACALPPEQLQRRALAGAPLRALSPRAASPPPLLRAVRASAASAPLSHVLPLDPPQA